jgi:uncharacterized membrane protein YdbT with pleckstrin-like domain
MNRVRHALLQQDSYHEVLVIPPPGSHANAVVRHHWAAYLRPILEATAGFLLLLLVPLTSVSAAWLPLVLGFGLIACGLVRCYGTFMSVLVISEMRIFQITGLPWKRRASMPLTRLLDITVDRPVLGAMLGYAHFTFESAAQTQGMKDVKFVPHATDYEKLILLHVHKS